MLWHDIAAVGSVVVMEALLSADNALVLAILVRHLPPLQQKRALRYGIWGALAFQFLCVVVATWLIRAWYFKVGGALYLLYVGISHLLHHDPRHEATAHTVSRASFWKTVLLVELTDLAFSIDSILAAAAMSEKLWVVYVGVAAAIIVMRGVAGVLLKLLRRFPTLAVGAYALVVWIGIKLLFEGWKIVAHQFGPAWHWSTAQIARYSIEMSPGLFWIGMAAIFASSLIWPARQKIHG